MTRWRGTLDEDDWPAIYVVVAGGHQSRYRETSLQYFQTLLHEREGMGAAMEDRVIFAEDIEDEEEMLSLLAKHINDQVSSNAFFGNRTRMQQDFLADATAQYLKELLPG